jgi:hypothetical protein
MAETILQRLRRLMREVNEAEKEFEMLDPGSVAAIAAEARLEALRSEREDAKAAANRYNPLNDKAEYN